MHVIDSHTEGEPTRVVIDGGPDLGSGSMAERRARFARDHDHVRRMLILEPRGSDALVGALLCEPVDKTCVCGLIFFNNAGYLGMCGHATIGTAVTLARLGRIGPGRHRFETPVGAVSVDLLSETRARVENVESYRHRKDVAVETAHCGTVTGDVAWGGNWFFLAGDSPVALTMANIPDLTRAALEVKVALARDGIAGDDGGEIDHVEFFGPPVAAEARSRNFVLCPGGAYDRSPCGTGTSAKLACLAADGKLAPGETWVQESIVGSLFESQYRQGTDGRIIPSITGRAFIHAETTLTSHPEDPFGCGIGG